ncbi:MAG: hypothetical protein AB4041_19925 [Microcystaceae cyanobacterium]
MKQLVIQITDTEKAEMLSKILASLDFVEAVKITEDQPITSETEEDFFALAGLWENRENLSIDTIRQTAWKEQEK